MSRAQARAGTQRTGPAYRISEQREAGLGGCARVSAVAAEKQQLSTGSLKTGAYALGLSPVQKEVRQTLRKTSASSRLPRSSGTDGHCCKLAGLVPELVLAICRRQLHSPLGKL